MKKSKTDIQPDPSFWSVIPAGGAGTRLWPLSTSEHPKFLLPITGDLSLLQQTYDRLLRVTRPEKIVVVSGEAYAEEIHQQLPDLATGNVIVEPEPRGTEPAIALAALHIREREPNAVMGSFAADHAILDEVAFAQAVETGIAAARDEWLVTIGIEPTGPETGYGYIERTENIVARSGFGSAYRANRFVEKPDEQLARSFLEAGVYLWNASMFIWQVSTFASTLQQLQPEVFAIVDSMNRTRHRSDKQEWASLPTISIDEGVMERVSEFAVVPSSMGWSDIGDWHSIGALLPVDSNGIASNADPIIIDSNRCVVWERSGKRIALLDVEELIVVDTPDALLIANRQSAQRVRAIVDKIAEETRPLE